MPQLYAMPTRDDQIRLPFPPLVQQWERNDHPAQVRLRAYLERVLEILGDRTAGDDLALCLSVGRTHIEPLDSDGRDLDNYLQPLAQAIGAAKLSAVFGRKIRAIESTVALVPARPGAEPPGEPHLTIRTKGSTDGVEWKEQIYDACAGVFREPTAGPVALTIRFGVSARRNWSTLWKPAIDALGPMLGMPHPQRFHPRDDRIVSLDLHRAVDDGLGDDVRLDMWCHPTPTGSGR